MFTTIETKIKAVFRNNAIELKTHIQNYVRQNQKKHSGSAFEKMIINFLSNTEIFTKLTFTPTNHLHDPILRNDLYPIACKTAIRNRVQIGKNLKFDKNFLMAVHAKTKTSFYLLNILNQKKHLANFKFFTDFPVFTFVLSKAIIQGFRPFLVIDF